MYMQYGDPERALAAGYLDSLDEPKIQKLVDCGAVHELYEVVSSSTLSSALWHQAVALFIANHTLAGIKAAWARKPQVVSQWTVRNACILAAQAQDLEFLAELEPLIPVGRDPVLARFLAPLVGPLDVSKLLEAQTTCSLSALAINHMPTPGSCTAVYNASLEYALGNYTALYLFALYRSFRTQGLAPNEHTWYILSKACFKLGNSKQLAYEIWREHVELGLAPSRRVAESLLLSQLQGLGCRTALYFVAQMHAHKIYLRNHVHFRLLKAFGPSTSYKEIFGDIRKLRAYRHWDPELAAAEAGKYAAQSRRNCNTYIEGGDLEQMLAFESI